MMKHTMMRKMTMLVSALVALALLITGLSLSPLAHAASADNASSNTTSSTSGSDTSSGSSSSTSATVPSQCKAIIPADSSAQQAGLDQLIQPSGDIKEGPDGSDGNPTSFTQAFSFNNTTTRQGATICITVPGENAKYVTSISVVGYEQKGSVPAWPSNPVQGYDAVTNTYYYAVTFPDNLPAFQAEGGSITVNYQRGMPTAGSSFTVHLSAADSTTNGKSIEQNGSPVSHEINYYFLTKSSEFTKAVAPDYSQNQGVSDREVQVIADKGVADSQVRALPRERLPVSLPEHRRCKSKSIFTASKCAPILR